MLHRRERSRWVAGAGAADRRQPASRSQDPANTEDTTASKRPFADDASALVEDAAS